MLVNAQHLSLSPSLSLLWASNDYVCKVEQFPQEAGETGESLAGGRAYRPISVLSLSAFLILIKCFVSVENGTGIP